MPYAYLALVRGASGVDDVLLAQKNVYLPPCERYPYASVARNALQYVIPGGRIQPGERPVDAAIRELSEDSGVTIDVATVTPLLSEANEHFFFQAPCPHGFDVNVVNGVLGSGRSPSQKFNNMQWLSLERAPGTFGNKPEHHGLRWAGEQVVRALHAGFSKEWIGQRVNAPHARFTKAVASLILAKVADDPGFEAAPGRASSTLASV